MISDIYLYNISKPLFIHINKCGGTSIKKIIGESKNKHEPIRDVLPRIDDPNNYFKFSFIRHPYDRIKSMYFYRKYNLRRVKLKEVSFEEWFYKAFTDTSYTAVQLMNKSCWHYLNIDGKLAVDYVGKFENMAEDWKFVAKMIDVSPILPHVNKTKHKEDVTFTSNMKQIVEQQFKWDLEQY